MSIKFGEVDANQIVDNEFRIGTLEKILEVIINKSASAYRPTKEEITSIKREVIKTLQKKYPSSGIKFKE